MSNATPQYDTAPRWLLQNEEGVPCVLLVGVPFWERAEVKDLLAYLRLAAGLSDDLSLERVINVPSRKIGKVSLTRLHAWAAARGGTLSEALFLSCQPDAGAAESSENLVVRAASSRVCVTSLVDHWSKYAGEAEIMIEYNSALLCLPCCAVLCRALPCPALPCHSAL